MDFGRAIAGARPRVVAALAARLRDLDAAEDAFSEASATALTAWPNQPPRDPAAWLWRAARAATTRGRAAQICWPIRFISRSWRAA